MGALWGVMGQKRFREDFMMQTESRGSSVQPRGEEAKENKA